MCGSEWMHGAAHLVVVYKNCIHKTFFLLSNYAVCYEGVMQTVFVKQNKMAHETKHWKTHLGNTLSNCLGTHLGKER